MSGPGMEMLFTSVQDQITCKEDAVMCCLHWCMISNQFKCIGAGEEEPRDGTTDKKSEMLPRGWNSDEGFYSLLYQPNKGHETYQLKVVKMDGTLLVHVMRFKDSKVATVDVKTNNFCRANLSSFESAYKDLESLIAIFQTAVIDELKPASKKSPKSKTKASSSRTHETRRDDEDPLRIPPRHGRGRPPPDWGESSNPFSVGRGDLDPLHRGGGMLMDPFRSGGPGRRPDYDAGMPGRLPRGAVPPGARFDPFGPDQPDRGGAPGRGRGSRAGPDPDHLPPPGYDDMFM